MFKLLKVAWVLLWHTSKLRSNKLRTGLRVSHAFLLCQAGGKDAQMQEKREICETLCADWLDSVYYIVIGHTTVILIGFSCTFIESSYLLESCD